LLNSTNNFLYKKSLATNSPFNNLKQNLENNSCVIFIPNYFYPIFATASLIRPAPVELSQDRKVARVDG